MAVRRCSACGATVDLPEAVRSTTCAFCGSALVDDDGSPAERVDRVAPFVVPRERAAALLRAYLAGRWFAPEALRRASRTDELREVLVPFYAFDAVARTSFSARIGLYWYRTETYTVTVNGKKETRTRRVRETEWFPLTGSHVRQWFDHLVSASRGLPEDEANQLEPFDLGRSLPFAPALVAGITTERPTVAREVAEAVAREELAHLERRVIATGHLPGDTHDDLETATAATLDPPRLVLLPVWIAVVRGPRGPVRLLVNGQTGEVAGAVPVSPWKVALAVLLALLVLGLVAVAVIGLGGLS